MRRELVAELMALSPAERIQVVEFLWDSIDTQPPLTAGELDELDRELAEHRADSSGAIPWEEVRAWLWSRRK
jgi:putative addiction module component (TIGR02574 family)